MISSDYVINVLKMVLDDDVEGIKLMEQIPYLSDIEYNYTNGSGLFVYFELDANVDKSLLNFNISLLDNIKITSTEPELEAYAQVFITEGKINYLEIWCVTHNYPPQDLLDYTMQQDWLNSPGKIMHYRNGKISA